MKKEKKIKDAGKDLDKDNKKSQLKELVKKFPKDHGVYLMKDVREQIIYVGKANNLKSRVQSYLGSSENMSVKTKYLVSKISYIDHILTNSESESLLLEASLIKKHQPKYNIRLKDDKSYPYIRLSMESDFPRFYISRKVKDDNSFYFGPYTSGMSVRDIINFMNKHFMLRDCSDHFMKTRKRACMTYEIGRCTAPCVKLIDKKNYKKSVDSAIHFLQKDSKKILSQMNKNMKEVSKEERFEAAAKIRDSILAIESIWKKQEVISQADHSQDIVAFSGDSSGTLIEVLHIRQGRLIGNRFYFFNRLDVTCKKEDPREWMTSFLTQYYLDNIIPEEIILPCDLGKDIYKLLQKVFTQRQKRKVKWTWALGPREKKLMDMAKSNAQSHFIGQIEKQKNRMNALEEIQKKLHLSKKPFQIECFDVSHFQGESTVASQVVFEDGLPQKKRYRRYKIKSVEGSNDFASLKEVLQRRFANKRQEDPDLIVVDGGKGQLKMAMEVLKEIERTDIPAVGMAKARTQGEFSESELRSSEERFFLPNRKNPVTFYKNSEALNILVHLRDESHRFAIAYHRMLRGKLSLSSELDLVSGLSQKKKQDLLAHFLNIEAIRQANIDEILSLPGFTQSLAQKVLSSLNGESKIDSK